MKKFQLLAAASAVGILSSVSSAVAFSIVNRDARPHVLVIYEGDEQREVALEPYGRADDLCTSSCEVNIDDGPDVYEVAANEELSIEDGELLAADEQTEEVTESPTEGPAEEPTELPNE